MRPAGASSARSCRRPWFRRSRVPATELRARPGQGGVRHRRLIRWLDFNDTWLAAEWGHPSDNLGAILAVADHLAQHRATADRCATCSTPRSWRTRSRACSRSRTRSTASASTTCCSCKVASTAVAGRLLGGSTTSDRRRALARHGSTARRLRTYRHAPNTGLAQVVGRRRRDEPRRAAGAAGRARRAGLPVRADRATLGLPGRALRRQRSSSRAPLGSYVMDNVLFKVAFPAEFHAQTAAECALQPAPAVRDRHRGDRADRDRRRRSRRSASSTRRGPLHNPADRDHCLQYIDRGRALLRRADRPTTTRTTSPPTRASTRCATDASSRKTALHGATISTRTSARSPTPCRSSSATARATERVEVEYPLGHPRRRAEARAAAADKLEREPRAPFGDARAAARGACCSTTGDLPSLPARRAARALARVTRRVAFCDRGDGRGRQAAVYIARPMTSYRLLGLGAGARRSGSSRRAFALAAALPGDPARPSRRPAHGARCSSRSAAPCRSSPACCSRGRRSPLTLGARERGARARPPRRSRSACRR